MYTELADRLESLAPAGVAEDLRILVALLGREVGEVVHFETMGQSLAALSAWTPPWMLPIARLRSGGSVLVDLRVARERGELHFVRSLGSRLMATVSLSAADHARHAVVGLAHHAVPGTVLFEQVKGWTALVEDVLGEPAYDPGELSTAETEEHYLAGTGDLSPLTTIAVCWKDPTEDNLARVDASAGRVPGFAYVHLQLSGLVVELGRLERFGPVVRDAFRAEAWGRYRSQGDAFETLELAGRLAVGVFEDGEVERAMDGQTEEGLRRQLQLAREAGDDDRILHVASDLGFTTAFDAELVQGTLIPLFDRRDWNWAIELCELRLGR